MFLTSPGSGGLSSCSFLAWAFCYFLVRPYYFLLCESNNSTQDFLFLPALTQHTAVMLLLFTQEYACTVLRSLLAQLPFVFQMYLRAQCSISTEK